MLREGLVGVLEALVLLPVVEVVVVVEPAGLENSRALAGRVRGEAARRAALELPQHVKSTVHCSGSDI